MPIDFSINDNDLNTANEREGILTYSPFNEDLSYQDVSRWLYTWIGSLWEPVSVKEDGQQVVNEFALSQNYPNPFNPTTQIKFSIKESGLVSLKIFDILGTEVATLVNNEYPVGNYTVDFNAVGLASGIYFYKIQSGNFVETKKMILMK
ncbi:MAG: T9SS type A sorting domain-containing protein [Ignavibacteriales bacterium]|nr:T9SS type A sorting domain-containing protein [Ignavibacteriales bacterium]MBP9121269.1 T9SS type A sorting domain-containing protein [Ignavibacterium sp.]